MLTRYCNGKTAECGKIRGHHTDYSKSVCYRDRDTGAALSNPEKRAAYDVNYEKETNHRWKTVSKGDKSSDFGTDRQIRRTILSILYHKRREAPL